MIKVCQVCLEEQKKMEERRKNEHKNVSLFDSKPKTENESFYLIDIEWIHSWTHFIWSENLPPPGPITNHHLLMPNQVDLKSDIQLKKHYRLIRKETWEYLLSIYGGGPPIVRNITPLSFL